METDDASDSLDLRRRVGPSAAGYSATASLGARWAVNLRVPDSPAWKAWEGVVKGNRVMLTAYQHGGRPSPPSLRRVTYNNLQPGVFHMVLAPRSNNELQGYGFRSFNEYIGQNRVGRPVWTGTSCNQSIGVTLRKL